MTTTNLKGNPIKLFGTLPSVNTIAPEFKLVKTDLSELALADLKGKKVILNIFPSVDTGVCATSVRKFNQAVNEMPGVICLCVSRDLPFAHARFCGAEGLEKVVSVSDFRYQNFGKNYGVEMVDGPLAGLLARSVVVLDENLKVVYTQLVNDIVEEPDYDKALAAL